MTFRVGQWVQHNGRVAVIFDRPEPDQYIVHYVNDDGTTAMRYDGPRGTESQSARADELTEAGWDAVPASRRPIDAAALRAIEAGTATMNVPFQPAITAQTDFLNAAEDIARQAQAAPPPDDGAAHA